MFRNSTCEFWDSRQIRPARLASSFPSLTTVPFRETVIWSSLQDTSMVFHSPIGFSEVDILKNNPPLSGDGRSDTKLVPIDQRSPEVPFPIWASIPTGIRLLGLSPSTDLTTKPHPEGVIVLPRGNRQSKLVVKSRNSDFVSIQLNPFPKHKRTFRSESTAQHSWSFDGRFLGAWKFQSLRFSPLNKRISSLTSGGAGFTKILTTTSSWSWYDNETFWPASSESSPVSSFQWQSLLYYWHRESSLRNPISP